MTSKKIYCHFLALIKPFFASFNLSGNSIYELPDNGLQIEILICSASFDHH